MSAPVREMSIDYFLNCPTGVVKHYFASPALYWSDELYRIHGYERSDIVHTLDLVRPIDSLSSGLRHEASFTASLVPTFELRGPTNEAGPGR